MQKLANDLTIHRLNGELPYQLLLLADENEKAINKYIHDCEVFTVKENDETIGVIAIAFLDNQVIEIKNLAIRTDYQKLGIGRKIIEWVKTYCIKLGACEILVGTGDASIYQLLFYLKCGFEMNAIRKSFFIENYDTPIYENGVRLKDMIVLKMDLEKKNVTT